MIRISRSGITPGQRLSFDIFDSQGRVLLLRGEQIASEEQAELIKQSGFRHERTTRLASVFEGISHQSASLAAIEKDFVEHRDRATLIPRIKVLARDLVDVADNDPDAAFANIHLEFVRSYTVVHSFMAALVSSRLALARGLDRAQRITLVSAALTHDIGFLARRKGFDASGDLSAEQRANIKCHTGDGVQVLRDLGVDDRLWLDAVRDHHEYLDGSGYAGKKEGELSLAARILALADSYSAMLRPRPYRERVVARTALETLYVDELARYDGSLLEILIWDFGFYPPGSLLRLANREIAVAIRNSPGILDSPRVASLTDPHGRPLVRPFARDTRNPAFAIVDTLDPAMAARSAKQIGECWSLDFTAPSARK